MASLLALMLSLGEGLQATPADNTTTDTADQGETALGQVTGVIDAASLRLADGRKIRLAGLEPALRPLDLPSGDLWPFADEAERTLATLVHGQDVSLRLTGEQADRHGHVLAHVERAADGLWLQGELLSLGLARVGTLPDTREQAPAMLAYERTARDARVGLWAHPAMAVRSPTNIRSYVDSFQIVEGLVLDVANVRGRTFLNFGPDWREDFTVTIAAGDRDSFTAAGVDPDILVGRSIRVRGWVGVRNGPVIEATHPEQIELLTAN